MLRTLLLTLFICLPISLFAQSKDHVAVIDMDMMILPGTQAYLQNSIEQAHLAGAKLLIVQLNTPGGIIHTSQEMIQTIFESELPVVIYVAPSGATATSAGVFITMAGHIAVMSPGTSIGAAHPVAGDGKDIEGDMRKKAENMTIAMVKSISEQRGRNVEWAEESVKESSSITANEAVSKKVVDFIARDINDLLLQLKGKKVKIKNQDVELGDFSQLPIVNYQISLKNKVINFFSDPNVAALLWLGATTGLSIELYNPGLILPGVVGVICLVLALTVMQVIPLTQTGIILFAVGGVMLMAEMFVPSGVLAIGGIIAMVIGAIYLVDPVAAPGLAIKLELIIPVAVFMAGMMLWILREIFKSRNQQVSTGIQGLIGEQAKVKESYFENKTIFINGEIWKVALEKSSPELQVNDTVEVVALQEGLILLIKKVPEVKPAL